MKSIKQSQKLIIALDVETEAEALRWVDCLSCLDVTFKVGLQLFYQTGFSILDELAARNCSVFVDLKLHDIPNTVAKGVESLMRHGVHFLNIHTLGGPDMMRAAATAGQLTARSLGIDDPVIIGVTVLTSLSAVDFHDYLKIPEDLESYVVHLAKSAQACGLSGVVCSAREASFIRQACGPEFLLITPGIRPGGTTLHDQSRVLTPAQAIAAGSDYLVVGRPVLQAPDPVLAARQILDEMAEAFSNKV